MIFVSWIRNQFRDTDSQTIWSFRAQIVVVVIQVVEGAIYALSPSYKYPQVSAFCRPVMVLLLFRSLRNYFYIYIRVVKGSLPMVTFIVIYIFYFSWFGYTIFQGTLQGTTFMPNMGDTVFNMIVLMTTSNYPDVMLPAY